MKLSGNTIFITGRGSRLSSVCGGALIIWSGPVHPFHIRSRQGSD